MYQEVFVFIAVNPEKAFGERDIDFSLYPLAVSHCRQTYWDYRQYSIICWTVRGIPYSRDTQIRTICTARFAFAKFAQAVLFSPY